MDRGSSPLEFTSHQFRGIVPSLWHRKPKFVLKIASQASDFGLNFVKLMKLLLTLLGSSPKL